MTDNFRKNPGDEEQYKFDPIVHAVTVNSHAERLVHDGMLFHASGKVTGMVDTNVDDFLISVPAGVTPHILSFSISTGRGDIDIVAYEGTTTSADGTEITEVFNTNRNSANVPGTALYSAPTISAVGTLIHTGWMPPTSTGTGQSGGGIVGADQGEEWLLQPSTKYLFRITNNSGATIAYRWEFMWAEISYEH